MKLKENDKSFFDTSKINGKYHLVVASSEDQLVNNYLVTDAWLQKHERTMMMRGDGNGNYIGDILFDDSLKNTKDVIMLDVKYQDILDF